MGTYTLLVDPSGNGYAPSLSFRWTNSERVYFGNRLMWRGGAAVYTDRLGSVGKYFPYGEERPSATAGDGEKFATYYRNGATGLDYAVNRYYDSGTGRFMTPDPYRASAGSVNNPADPGSWNRYAYTVGDPINFKDPTGLMTYPGDDTAGPSEPTHTGGGGSGVGGPYIWVPGDEGAPGYWWDPVVGTPAAAGGSGVARPIGFPGARNDLFKPDCYRLFGFQSAADAQRRFDGINFQMTHLCRLQIQLDASENLVIAPRTPPPARMTGNTVQVNYDYNWIDFSQVLAVNLTTGGTDFINYLAALNNALGANMNTSELGQLILLHELRHVLGAPQEARDDEFRAFNREIYDKCIR